MINLPCVFVAVYQALEIYLSLLRARQP